MTQDNIEFRKKFRRMFENVAASMDRKLTDEQATAYYHGLCRYDLGLLAIALDNLLSVAVTDKDGYRNLPTVGDIITEVRHLKAEKASRALPFRCAICNNSGLVMVDSPDRQPIAYRCECGNGDRQDKGIKSWAEVKHKYAPPADYAPPPLPLVTIQMIEMMPDNQVYEGGCEVNRLCETCNAPYSVRHERRITGQTLKEFYTRPGICDSCFDKEGRKLHLWA